MIHRLLIPMLAKGSRSNVSLGNLLDLPFRALRANISASSREPLTISGSGGHSTRGSKWPHNILSAMASRLADDVVRFLRLRFAYFSRTRAFSSIISLSWSIWQFSEATAGLMVVALSDFAFVICKVDNDFEIESKVTINQQSIYYEQVAFYLPCLRFRDGEEAIFFSLEVVDIAGVNKLPIVI